MQDDQSIWTVLQKVRIQKGTSTTPDAAKQGSAFPPNFIHSLDSTHMMMTALACKDAGERPASSLSSPLAVQGPVTSSKGRAATSLTDGSRCCMHAKVHLLPARYAQDNAGHCCAHTMLLQVWLARSGTLYRCACPGTAAA